MRFDQHRGFGGKTLVGPRYKTQPRSLFPAQSQAESRGDRRVPSRKVEVPRSLPKDEEPGLEIDSGRSRGT